MKTKQTTIAKEWQKQFDKEFGKYTFCETNNGGIMVWGSDEPKKLLKAFISKVEHQATQRAYERVREEVILKQWKPDWRSPAESDEELGYRKGLVAEHNLQAKEQRDKLQQLQDEK